MQRRALHFAAPMSLNFGKHASSARCGIKRKG
jgi:hypothetical protein